MAGAFSSVVLDDFTSECCVLVADTSLPRLRVVREHDGLIVRRGRPVKCVSDNDASQGRVQPGMTS
jgi:hypothetical protein